LLGVPYTLKGEIETFLSKRPLKQAASTLYSMQKGGLSKEGIDVNDLFDDLKPLLEKDLTFLEKHYPPALDLIPMRYRNFTISVLSTFVDAMTKQNIDLLKQIDFYPD
jgi:hypothetical protein